MASVFESVGSWLGFPSTPTPPPVPQSTPAPPRKEYPTKEDAQFAQKQDYSYGQPSAPYATGEQYRVLTGDWNASPYPAANIRTGAIEKFNAMPEHIRKALDNFYMRAQLAVESSPLAKLGFDPSKTALDLIRDPSKMRLTVTGEYTPKTDDIYANVFDTSAIVHESVHRGIEKLRPTPFWKPEFEQFARGDMNEMVVRRIMNKKMGDPESEAPGAEGAKEIARSKYWFDDSSRNKELSKTLDALEKAAADYIAAKHPGGPR